MSDELKIVDDWTIRGRGTATVAVFGDPRDEIARCEVFEDAMSVDCHDGVHIPDVVLAEWLRRKGWTVLRPKDAKQ